MVDPFAIGGILEIIYGALAVVFAWVVYKADPARVTNRSLAILLLVDGATSGGLVVGISRFIADAQVVQALTAVKFLGNGSRPFLYLAFIAAAMPLAWTRPFEHRFGRGTLYLLAAAGGLTAAVFGLQHPLVKDSLQAGFVVVGVVGLVSAVVAFRRTRGDARQKMRAYLQAFAVRDLGVLVLLPIRDLATDGSLFQGWMLVAVKIVYVAFILLVVYGVLFGQIVDLDATARAAFTRTAAVTIVAAGFVVITELAESYIPTDALPFETPIALATSVLMAFMFQPIQEHTEGLALKLFPGQSVGAGEYALAVEQALAEGEVRPAEQKVLEAIWERHRA